MGGRDRIRIGGGRDLVLTRGRAQGSLSALVMSSQVQNEAGLKMEAALPNYRAVNDARYLNLLQLAFEGYNALSSRLLYAPTPCP
eukprot:1477630-Rhodomonas_salina.1